MNLHRIRPSMIALVVAAYVVLCAPYALPAMPEPLADTSGLWEEPGDIADRDLFNGPWGQENAPDPHAVYKFLRPKKGGTNPGVVVQDPLGRVWHVKQPPPRRDQGVEGPAEVVLSRLLSALGYHQPPVYFLPSFMMSDASGTRMEPGGRFRLNLPSLTERGEWSWDRNPFVNTRPYNGLLVILLMLNSSDLKDSNNTLYDVVRDQGVERWYVIRDLGSALGKTSRYRAKRNNIEHFERTSFILGVDEGFVEFDYHGKNTELVRRRITPADVGWAGALIGRLSRQQWEDAFRAGGYQPDVAARFINKLSERIAQANQVGGYSQQTEGQ